MAVRAGAKITYGYLGTWSPDEGKAWALNCMIVDWNSENPIREKKIRILYCPYCGKS